MYYVDRNYPRYARPSYPRGANLSYRVIGPPQSEQPVSHASIDDETISELSDLEIANGQAKAENEIQEETYMSESDDNFEYDDIKLVEGALVSVEPGKQGLLYPPLVPPAGQITPDKVLLVGTYSRESVELIIYRAAIETDADIAKINPKYLRTYIKILARWPRE